MRVCKQNTCGEEIKGKGKNVDGVILDILDASEGRRVSEEWGSHYMGARLMLQTTSSEDGKMLAIVGVFRRANDWEMLNLPRNF